MDASLQRSVLWFAAPAGSGKTTAIKSFLEHRKLLHLWYQIDERDADVAALFYYLGLAAKAAQPRRKSPLPLLTPEYADSVTAFARRYFETLYARLAADSRRRKGPYVIVFDNYQEVASGSAFHDIMRVALSGIPEGVSVFVASRAEPPPELARLRAAGAIDVLGWESLRLTSDEARAIVRAQPSIDLADDAVERIHRRADGWAAGILLFARSATRAAIDYARIDRLRDDQVFDYFANELFDGADPRVRDFLLKTAFLNGITPRVAEELTGDEHGGRILAQLHRDNHFTERRQDPELSYQYHPLFREFLLARARGSMSRDKIRDLQLRAGRALAASGQVEDAADVFAAAESWGDLAAIVARSAPMLATQGRLQTVGSWLRSFPLAVVDASPWLLFWSGVCRFSDDPHESRRLFEQAFTLFRAQRDVAGTFLAWAGVVESILWGWNDFVSADPWIDALDALLRAGMAIPEGEARTRITSAMVAAVTLRRPDHPEVATWVQRGLEVAHSTADIRTKSFLSVYLELYFLWVGDHAGAERIITQMQRWVSSADAPPAPRIVANVTGAVYYARLARHDLCMDLVREGLEIAEATGLHRWDAQLYSQATISSLCAGDVAAAKEYAAKMRRHIDDAQRIDACMYYYNVAWIAVVDKDVPLATQHAEAAMQAAREAGTPMHIAMCHVALAQVCHERGDAPGAAAHLARGADVAAAMKSRILEYMIALAAAQFALDRGDEALGLEKLAEAFALGKAQGYVNFYWWRADVMSRLAATALEHGIEVAFVEDLVRRRNLDATPRARYVESWPWRLRIRTFGAIELVRDGAPLSMAASSNKKPLELLKVLIALGGRDASAETIVAHLWPDADGDLAHISFDTTLHRLRKLLGDNRLLPLADGHLALEARSVWVDAWAFDSALEEAHSARTSKTAKRRLFEMAIRLYRGHFLAPEGDRAWALPTREKLRGKFVRAACALGALYEEAGEHETALSAYERAIEIDDIAEPAYARAVAALVRLGRHAEAKRIHGRCRDTLRARLGAEPSFEVPWAPARHDAPRLEGKRPV